MSGLFVNKVAGALLASALGFIMINKFSNMVMHADVPEPDKFAYSLAAEAPTKTAEVVPVAFPSPAWLGARDAEKGAKVFKKCKSCHDAAADKKDGTGPHLWGVVGRPKGSVAGFSYSDGMKAKGGTWTYEDLNEFLTKPSKYVPKTKMSFNGLKKETDRAAIIEYLRLASDSPMPPLTAKVETPDDTAQDMAQDTADAAEGAEKMAGEAVEKKTEEVKPAEEH